MSNTPNSAWSASNLVISISRLGFDHVISYSVDGSGNNLANPTLGAAGSDEVRIAPARFAPGTTDTRSRVPTSRDQQHHLRQRPRP